MNPRTFDYPCLLVKQGPDAPALVLFSASAVDINDWVGIPQKGKVLEGETLGFQRDENAARVEQIAQFFAQPKNVIHNPLLCAIREKLGVEVSFEPSVLSSSGDAVPGRLRITFPNREKLPFGDLVRQAREALECRVPELVGRADPEDLIAKLRGKLDGSFEIDENDVDEVQVDDDESGAGAAEPIEEALFQESHVTDFWNELKAREILLAKLGSQFKDDEFLGIDRPVLEAYLRPVILVDGQHRLLGALKAARDKLNDDDVLNETASRMARGDAVEDVAQDLLKERARQLPISMILDETPGEHVFQFVVVNQKATPVKPALLATIISTSLSEAELAPIGDRLEDAGIPLKSSRAISFLVKNPKSPFMNLVTRGLSSEGVDLLPWTVLGQLVTVFRDLKGARFYHESKMDYADIWRRRFLEQSPVAAPIAEKSSFEVWREPDGPWRDVFIEFWTAVRDELGSTSNPDAYNFWGRPRGSNLFNKPSLTTLATDFFAYLVETRKLITSADDVSALTKEWLLDVDRNYFNRDWKLAGVKKDAPGTRKQWSKVWYSYRRDPRALPRIGAYSTLYKD